MKTLAIALMIVAAHSVTFAQASRPIPPGVRQADEAEEQSEKSIPPPLSSLKNLKDLQREANELAELASTVPSQVQQVNRGILPKDLSDRLKKIEKLSKHLRAELNP